MVAPFKICTVLMYNIIITATMCYRIVAFSQAEAYAIKAKAAADAEQMSKKAEAWKEYGSAAMVDMMLDTLPKV